MLSDKRTLAQIDAALSEVDRARSASPYDDLSGGVGDGEINGISARCYAVVRRVCGQSHVYTVKTKRLVEGPDFPGVKLLSLGSILHGLRAEVEAGFLVEIVELAHADVFADLLDMADELASHRYKDAAAVVSGSALEAHLRKLAGKHGLPTTKESGDAYLGGALKDSLVRDEILDKIDGQGVTSWLALRNQAAHGHYEHYDIGRVQLMIDGVRDFIRRNPA